MKQLRVAEGLGVQLPLLCFVLVHFFWGGVGFYIEGLLNVVSYCFIRLKSGLEWVLVYVLVFFEQQTFAKVCLDIV